MRTVTARAAVPAVTSGAADATVFLGAWGGASSSAQVEHPGVGVDITHRLGASTWSLEPAFEYAAYCAVGAATINGSPVAEGQLLQWEPGTADVRFANLPRSGERLPSLHGII